MSFYRENKNPNFSNFKTLSIFNPLEKNDSNNKLNDVQVWNLYEIYKNKKENKVYIAHTTTTKKILNIYHLIDISKAELSHTIDSEGCFFEIKYHSFNDKEYLILLTYDNLLTIRDINNNFSKINTIKTNYNFSSYAGDISFLLLGDKILSNNKYYNILENDTLLQSQFENVENIIPWEDTDKLCLIMYYYDEIKIYDSKNGENISKVIKRKEEQNYLEFENSCVSSEHFFSHIFQMFLYNKKNKNYLFISNSIGIIQVYDLNNFKYVCSIHNLKCTHVGVNDEEKDELGYPSEYHRVVIKFYLYNEKFIIFVKYENVELYENCNWASLFKKYYELYVFDVDSMKVISKYQDFKISDYEIKLLCLINNNS